MLHVSRDGMLELYKNKNSEAATLEFYKFEFQPAKQFKKFTY